MSGECQEYYLYYFATFLCKKQEHRRFKAGCFQKRKKKRSLLACRTITIYYFRFWGENEETKGVARCAFSVVFFFPPYLNPTKTPNVQLIVPLSSFKKYSSVPFSCL